MLVVQGSWERNSLFMYSHEVEAHLFGSKLKIYLQSHRHVTLSLNDYANTNG